MVDVRMRDYAVAIPLDPEDKVLLQNKDGGYWFWPNMWCTFGGGVRESEDPRTTLDREMGEEHGLHLTDVELFDSREYSDSGHNLQGDLVVRAGVTHYFSARFDGDLGNITLKEGAGIKTFSRLELIRYNEFGLVVPPNFRAINDFYESLRSES